MRIEVLCTGDELLTGLIADTNSPVFQEKLFRRGEKVQRTVIVGDVHADIIAALLEASGRADAVLVSGGLGPTSDDLTVECVAKAAGVRIVENAPTLESIKERFAKRGLAFTANNARQAMVPEGAEVVRNPVGSAPMFTMKLGECRFFFVPGVPREYHALVDQEVLPRLDAMIAAQKNRVFRASAMIKCVGIAESHLDQKVRPIALAHPKVVFGFRTHAPENHLKLMSEAGSQAEADRLLAACEAECQRELIGFSFGGRSDDFGDVVGALLEGRTQTVALAESCTGGLATELLTARAGASAYVIGGAVTYQSSMKTRWASVDPKLIEAHSAVSRPVAEAMARGVREQTGATYGLSITGYAGPGGGTEADPVGTVYCALADGQTVRSQRHLFLGERDRVRAFAAYAALEQLRRTLLGLEVSP